MAQDERAPPALAGDTEPGDVAPTVAGRPADQAGHDGGQPVSPDEAQLAREDEPGPARRGRGAGGDPVAWLIALAVFAAYDLLSIFKYLRLAPGSWDLGIFTEYVKQVAHLHAPVVAIRGTGFNLLGDHFQPIVALIAPFFRVFPTPETLLVAQALLTAISVVPVCRAAQELLGTWPSRGIGLAYGFSWGLQQMITFDFHEIAFAVPLLAFSLSALVRRRLRPAVLWAVPLVFVKEDQGFTIAAIGLVMAGLGLASLRRERHPTVLARGDDPPGTPRWPQGLVTESRGLARDKAASVDAEPVAGGVARELDAERSAGLDPATPRSAGLDPATPRSAGLDPATPRSAGLDPATPRSAGLDPATPRSAGLDPATPPNAWIRAGILLAVWGLAWSALAIAVIIPHFNATHQYPYWNNGGVVAPGGHLSLGAVAHQFAAGATEKLWTVYLILLPVAFLALRSPLALIAVPSLALRFVSTNNYFWGDGWHYNATVMPIVFLAAVDGMASVRAASERRSALLARGSTVSSGDSFPRRHPGPRRPRTPDGPEPPGAPPASPSPFTAPERRAARPHRAGRRARPGLPRPGGLVARYGAAVMVIVAAWMAFRFPLAGLWSSQTYVITPHVSAEAAAIAKVPDGVTVEATLSLLAPLAARDNTYWIGTSPNPAPQYIVFDNDDSGWSPPPTNVLAFVDQRHPGYQYVRIFLDNNVYVFRRDGRTGG